MRRWTSNLAGRTPRPPRQRWLRKINCHLPVACSVAGGRALGSSRVISTKLAAWTAIVVVSANLPGIASVQFPRAAVTVLAASEVYIQQSRGHVSPGSTILTKPPPETTTAAPPSVTPTAPETCNAQNASSQACYTATQQARPAGR
jgi:hypothetical protein